MRISYIVATAALCAGLWLGEGAPALAQPPYADLSARSAALTDDLRDRARESFSIGFGLWQAGDCAAAVMAFRRGLDIDPANPQANYYHGDCLQKLRRRLDATEAFKRAAALGEGTPEGFKALAALEALSKPVPIREMSRDELRTAYVGVWAPEGKPELTFTITQRPDGELEVGGEPSCFLFCANMRYVDLQLLDDGSIRFGITNSAGNFYRFRLVARDRLEGAFTSPRGNLHNMPVTAVRSSPAQ